MKLFKVFLKDCIKSYWFWITAILTIITIIDVYFKILGNFAYMTQILCSLVIICSVFTCYSLYLKIALKYPDILIADHKDLEFEDFCSFFELNKLCKKIYSRYKINIIEDENNFLVDSCYGNSVTLQLFSKIYIKNATNNTIELSEPIINLVSVNNISDDFFINRLKVSLKKIRYSNERYADHYDYIPPLKRQRIYNFPYNINPKENLCIFLYLEIDFESDCESSFDELLEWIRSINLKMNITLIKEGKEISNTYNIKYNFKSDLVKNMIHEKLKSQEEIENLFN